MRPPFFGAPDSIAAGVHFCLSLRLGQFQNGNLSIVRRLNYRPLWCPDPCRHPNLYAPPAPFGPTRTVDNQGLQPVSTVFCFWRMRVFGTIMASKVVNRCKFPHSKRRRRVLFWSARVSLTTVQAPHSGHLIIYKSPKLNTLLRSKGCG